MNEKAMIESYIYEVTKRVPSQMRDEIRLELQTLIDDMCAQEELSVDKVLQKLGNPAAFAERYRDSSHYLIGPDYYENYIWGLKLVFIAVGISALVSGIVQGLLNATDFIHFFIKFFTEFFATGISGALCSFGIITLIFAILERQNVKVSIKPEENWSVKDLTVLPHKTDSWSPLALPPVPDKRALISRGDSIVSIIFLVIFGALLIFAPQIFGAFHYENDQMVYVASIFNFDAWSSILPVFILCLSVGLINEIIRLATGYYCKLVMCSNIVCNILQIAGAVVLLKVLPLWNPSFLLQMQEAFGIEHFSMGDILAYWGSDIFNNIALCIVVLACLFEMGVTIYKTIRYSKS